MSETEIKRKLYLFDADGTLRRCKVEGQPCPNKPEEWELLADVKPRLALIDWDATAAGIVSNQGGIAHGYLTEGDAVQMLEDTLCAATGTWCPVWPIMVCPHMPDAGCRCRKPAPTLIWEGIRAARFAGCKLLEHEVRRDGDFEFPEVLFVGDQIDDWYAARHAAVPFQWAHDFFGWTGPAEGDGIAWQGDMRQGNEKILVRVQFRDRQPIVSAWIDGAWQALPRGDDGPTLRNAALSKARASKPFWATDGRHADGKPDPSAPWRAGRGH